MKCHNKIAVIIVYRDNDALSVILPGKRVLAVGEQKFIITTIGKCFHLLPYFSERRNQTGKRILFCRIRIIRKPEGRAQRVIGKTLFPSLQPELGSIVNRRHSRKRVKQNVNRCKVRLIRELCVYPLNVMIIHKIVKL